MRRAARSRVGRVVTAVAVAGALVLTLGAFGDGQYAIGSGPGQLPPGTYTTAGGSDCYWARHDAFGGIIANDFEIDAQRHIVTVEAGDGSFETSRCGDWQPLPGGPMTADPAGVVPDGTWRVGVDMLGNNRWVSQARAGCYWERLRNFDGDFGGIIDNFFGDGPTLVTLDASDVGFRSSGCGPWVRDPSLDPFGALDIAAPGFSGLHVVGWAQDRDVGGPIAVHIYVDGTPVGALSAGQSRADVGPHGFDGTVPIGAGTHAVCAFGINGNLGINRQLGCRFVTVVGTPIGALERTSYRPNGLTVAGWALDPNTTGPITVHVYVDGAVVATPTASDPRPDVAGAFPGYGPNHGYATTISIGGGSHTVCAYGINVGIGANSTLGCRAFTTPSLPFGALDPIGARYDVATVRGWAIDPNTTAPVQVHVYVDGQPSGAVTADVTRPDLGPAFPGYGSDHGYRATLHLANGTHQVCAYGINVGPGSNSLLGCREIATNGNPIGALDAVTRAAQGIRARGWAFDPDSAGNPVTVHVYVDGRLRKVVTTGQPRPEIPSVVPGAGSDTGYVAGPIAVAAGSHEVCAYAINVGTGAGNTTLGCRVLRTG